MTPLPQQLEDKKKKLKVIEDDIVNCKIIKKSVVSYLYKGSDDEKYYKQCIHDKKRLEAEIAILEQAIAEMQKRDKDELDLLMEIKTHQESWRWHEYPVWHDKVENKIEKLQSQQKIKVNPCSVTKSDNLVDTSLILKPITSSYTANDTKTADISNLLQKQRQEEIEWIKKMIKEYGWDIEAKNGLKIRLKQLNQPKTEE